MSYAWAIISEITLKLQQYLRGYWRALFFPNDKRAKENETRLMRKNFGTVRNGF